MSDDVTHISPSVLLPDGKTVTVHGWMLVLAFATKGIPWAVEQVRDPKYDIRGRMSEYFYKEYRRGIPPFRLPLLRGAKAEADRQAEAQLQALGVEE